MKAYASICPLGCLSATPASAATLERIVDRELSELAAAYKDIHAHPELSPSGKGAEGRAGGRTGRRQCVRRGPHHGERGLRSIRSSRAQNPDRDILAGRNGSGEIRGR
jgi:hypothetical protein